MREMEEDGLRVLGTLDAERQVGVVSVVSGPGQCRGRLPPGKGVRHTGSVRPSLRPAGHKTLGTFPQGTVRFSVNPLTRFEDIDYLQAAVCEVMGDMRIQMRVRAGA